MTDSPILPFASAAIVDGNGKLTLEGTAFLRKIVAKLQGQITQLSDTDANMLRVLGSLTGPDGQLLDLSGLNVDELAAIAAVQAPGVMVRDALGQWYGRTLTDTGEIAWTNGSGLSGNPGAALVATGVTPGTYGDASHIPVPTVDSKGRITGITTVAVGASSNGGILITGGSIASTAALLSGFVVDAIVPAGYTLSGGWDLMVYPSGSLTLDIRKGAFPTFPAVTSIVAAAPPSVTAASTATGAYTGWTTAVAREDTLRAIVTSVSGVKWFALLLKGTKT